MLCFETVEPETLELLRKLQGCSALSETRLVGGTALALQIGHRKSIDLDFFGSLICRDYELEQLLKAIGNTRLINRSKLIEVYQVCGVKLDFVDYAYPWLTEPIVGSQLRLASIDDIAAMKLSAITNRGTKKDFIDLYFLLGKYSIKRLFELYKAKYSDSNVFPVIKSLTWFEDADEEPMPIMLKPCDWDDVKETIINTVSEYSH